MRFYLDKLFIRNDGGIPTVCNDDCNIAYSMAMVMGLEPALCNATAAFRQELGSCASCVAASAGPANGAQIFSDPKFENIVLYCEAIGSPIVAPSFTSTVESPKSNAWVAGPVVGSVAGVGFMSLAIVSYAKRRKMKKARLAKEPAESAESIQLEAGDDWNTGDKPQLHSDDIKLHELDAVTEECYEMAAHEPAATELHDDYDPLGMPGDLLAELRKG